MSASLVLGLAIGLPAAAIAAMLLWSRRNRAYHSSESVAAAYDAWTDDRLLENLWGEHVHLGHYGDPPRQRDFRNAKADFVHALVHWSGLDQLPPGSKLLDVGCGIGGSARILARDYGFDVLGISISPAQVQRATDLTPENLSCRFAVMDALDLQLADQQFDAVWSVEAGPHMPDKQRYADELLRVLKPGGSLAVADWNRRDPSDGEMNRTERWVMHSLSCTALRMPSVISASSVLAVVDIRSALLMSPRSFCEQYCVQPVNVKNFKVLDAYPGLLKLFLT